MDLGRPGDRPVTFVAVLHRHGNILLGHPNPEAEGVVHPNPEAEGVVHPNPEAEVEVHPNPQRQRE